MNHPLWYLILVFFLLNSSGCITSQKITEILEGEKIVVPPSPAKKENKIEDKRSQKDVVPDLYPQKIDSEKPSSQSVVKPAIVEHVPSSPAALEKKEYIKPEVIEKDIPVHIIEERFVPVYTLPESPDRDCETEAQAVNLQFVQERLKLYENKKRLWNDHAAHYVTLDMGGTWPAGWHNCLQNIEMVLFGYSRVMDENFSGLDEALSKKSRVDIWMLLGEDLRYLESGCDKLLSESLTGIDDSLGGFVLNSRRKASSIVGKYYENGSYEQAVNFYNDLSDEDRTVEVKRVLSQSLSRLGRFSEAADVLSEVLQDSGFNEIPMREAIALKIEYADLLFAAGRKEETKITYLNLSDLFLSLQVNNEWVSTQAKIISSEEVNPDAMNYYGNLMRAYKSFDGKRLPEQLINGLGPIDGMEGDNLLMGANMILQRAEAQSAEWADGQLAKIEELIHDQDFDAAVFLSDKLLIGAPDHLQSRLVDLKEEIKHAREESYKIRRQIQAQADESHWEEAVHLFEQKKYEEAMASFAGLLSTGYKEKAQKKMNEAADLAAGEMRRRAASLFVKAKKTFTFEKKKRLLLESRNLLNQLIDRYPTFKMVDKAKQNLQVLEAEIQQLEQDVTEKQGVFEGE